MMFDLTGRSAFVTGASGGIGAAIARALAAQGASVALGGTRLEPLQALAAEIGDKAHIVTAYIGDRADAPWAGGPSWQALGAIAASAALFVEVVVVIGLKTSGRLSHQGKIDSSFGRPYEIGRLFLTDHLLAFEITSIVLLIAAVGGVILGAHTRRMAQ